MGRRNPPRKQANKTDIPRSQLRIIGGDWRGRKIEFFAVDGLRPTPDRVRETLFNWIQSSVPGAQCLDLFSGSGALGLEALSRGAGSMTFIDLNPTTSRKLKDNIQLLKCQKAEVIQANVLEWLQSRKTDCEQRYDLVFLDPPFRQDLIEPCCELLETHNLLSENALIYVESESELSHPNVPAHWHEHRQKTAGQVTYRLYMRNN